MDLRELLGEELFNQVVEKVGDNKLAVVSDGNWFPKSKFDEVNSDNKELKKQLKDRDTQLEDLSKKAAGNEDLLKQIQTLQADNERVTNEYQSKLSQQAFDFALKDALTSAKAKNPKAVEALLNKENIKLDGDKLSGLEDQLKALKESDSYLFEADQQQPPSVKFTTGSHKKEGGLTKEQFDQMGYSERIKIYNEDPELYKQLND